MEREDKIMPYIKEEDRAKYNGYIRDITNQINRLDVKDLMGHLNYIITEILLNSLPFKRYYQFIYAKVILEDIKHEIERRLQDPYEDRKIKENGDVY